MPKKIPELKVVFDTNVLMTEAVSKLVRIDVKELIEEHSNHKDLKISWCLPDTVVHERHYQMRQAGRALLPSVAKVEALLGHQLNITEEILDQRIGAIVDREVADHGLTRISLDPAKADWGDMMLSAAYRRPPFEGPKKEKGFRDALILETFAQLLDVSPQSASTCIVALVTADSVLSDAATARTTSRSNVRILSDLEALRGLINTLVSEVGEDVLKAIRDKARDYFFVKDDKTTYFFRAEVMKAIGEKFSDELKAIPPGADTQQWSVTFVNNPDFQRKVKRRFHWTTRVRCIHKLFKKVPVAETDLGAGSPVGGVNPLVSGLLSSQSTPTYNETLLKLLSASSKVQTEPLPGVEKVFEVQWSISVGMNSKISSPKIDDIKFVGVIPATP